MTQKSKKHHQHIFCKHLVNTLQDILKASLYHMTQKRIGKHWAKRRFHSTTISLSVIFSIKNEN